MEASNSSEKGRQLEICLEMFLRLICGLALAEYLSGAKDEKAEARLEDFKQRPSPSLGHYVEFGREMIRVLAKRPEQEAFLDEMVRWYFTGRGKLTKPATKLGNDLIRLRNVGAHGAAEERTDPERVNHMHSLLREVFLSAEGWLLANPFCCIKEKKKQPGKCEGTVVWFVGPMHRTQSGTLWTADRLDQSSSLLVTTPRGEHVRGVMDLGYLLQVDATMDPPKHHLFYGFSKSGEVVLQAPD